MQDACTCGSPAKTATETASKECVFLRVVLVGNYEMLLMKEGNQVFNQMLLIDIDLSIVCTSFKKGTIKS